MPPPLPLIPRWMLGIFLHFMDGSHYFLFINVRGFSLFTSIKQTKIYITFRMSCGTVLLLIINLAFVQLLIRPDNGCDFAERVSSIYTYMQ